MVDPRNRKVVEEEHLGRRHTVELDRTHMPPGGVDRHLAKHTVPLVESGNLAATGAVDRTLALAED